MAALRIRVVTAGAGGGPSSPARRFIVGSLIVHVVLAVAIVWIPGLRRGQRLPANATVVELVAALPGPRTVAPPAPAAREAPPVPPAPTPAPTPKGVSVPKPSAKPKKTPERKEPVVPQATPAPPSPETGGEPQAAAHAGAGGEAGSAASGGSVSAFELGDAAFAWYRGAVANALYGAWRRPIVSGLVQPVEVRVAFEIMRDGNVRGLRIEQSSGVPVLDRSALRAVGDASPLPALPASLSEPYLPASIVFRLYPEGGQG